MARLSGGNAANSAKHLDLRHVDGLPSEVLPCHFQQFNFSFRWGHYSFGQSDDNANDRRVDVRILLLEFTFSVLQIYGRPLVTGRFRGGGHARETEAQQAVVKPMRLKRWERDNSANRKAGNECCRVEPETRNGEGSEITFGAGRQGAKPVALPGPLCGHGKGFPE